MGGHDDQDSAVPGTHGPGRDPEPDPDHHPIRPRPGFLPPLARTPAEPPDGAAHEPPALPSHPTGAVKSARLGVMTIVATVVMMLSAFLPWAHAETNLTFLGRSLGRDLGSIAGVDADGSARLIPALALVALGVVVWGMIAENPRIGTYAAAPGGLALLCCGIFLIRLNDAQDGIDFGPAGLDYALTLGYGWFVAAAAALILTGLSLAALFAAPPAATGHPPTGTVSGPPSPHQS